MIDWLERAIAWLWPTWALRRKRAPLAMEQPQRSPRREYSGRRWLARREAPMPSGPDGWGPPDAEGWRRRSRR
jgi:hypothetical protein